MGKRIVVATSTSCLDYYPHHHNIRMIRIKLEIGGKLYDDGTEMPADRFYQMLKDDPTLIPKTTQTSVEHLLEFFEGLYEEGYDEVFCPTISSKLSGSINGIETCADILADRMHIVAYDTKTVTFNEGLFALKAADMIEHGASFDEVKEKLDWMSTRNMVIFAVEHLDFLIKNGRLSNAAGFAANMLNIKPLLEVQNDGEIRAVRKIRTIQRAITAVAERVKEYTDGHDYYMFFMSTTSDRMGYLHQEVDRLMGIRSEDCLYIPATPIVGCHVGNDALGVGIMLKD